MKNRKKKTAKMFAWFCIFFCNNLKKLAKIAKKINISTVVLIIHKKKRREQKKVTKKAFLGSYFCIILDFF